MEDDAPFIDFSHEELNVDNEGQSSLNPPSQSEIGGEENGASVDLELEAEEGNVDNEDDAPKFQKKKRQKKSTVHNDFKDVTLKNGIRKYQCIHCTKVYAWLSSGTTSHLLTHSKSCEAKKLYEKKQQRLQFQPSKSKFEMSPLSNGKYDHLKQREAIAQWVLMADQPFNVVENDGFTFMFKVNLPQFEKISWATVRNDVKTVYEIEKAKLRTLLNGIKRVSLTTDIWKSKVQKISYMCVTGHFLDSDWQLQKRVLGFMALPPPHTGVEIFDGLMKCTKEWGIEHKIFSISVDNASNNDVALRFAQGTFSSSRKLPLDGKLFHVRCAAHILNLVVQDGLEVIKDITLKVKKSVRFINKSEGRLLKFSEIVHHLVIPVKRLIIDCPTRWNATYEMLREAIKVRDAFTVLAQRDASYKSCPSDDDWIKVRDVISILEVFYEATHVLSGTHHPTANVLLAVIWRVKYVIDENANHENIFIKNMTHVMNEKFEKYWGNCNLLMAIGAILDPRFKMKLIDFAFGKLYNGVDAHTYIRNVRDELYKLFFEYVDYEQTRSRRSQSVPLNKNPQQASSCSSSREQLVPSALSMFDDYLNMVQEESPLKSELDIYLEEGVFRCQESQEEGDKSTFDALAWWKSQELKFKILSKLARDIFAIPISTVASESTFSAGTRAIDPHRANLSSDMVEVLICGGDWVRQLHGIKKEMKTYEEEQPIEVMLRT